MADEIHLRRSVAAELLDRIRIALAERVPHEHIEQMLARERGLMGPWPVIPPLKRCEGEAHRNAYIDNCGECLPRWGWIGPRIVVK